MATRIQRVTHLREPVEVGKFYLVPTVMYPYLSPAKPAGHLEANWRVWPVFMTRHEDTKFLDFPYWHYHVDPRFLNKVEVRKLANRYSMFSHSSADEYEKACRTAQQAVLSRFNHEDVIGPTMRDADSKYGELIHPPVIWRRKRCYHDFIPYHFGAASAVERLRDHFGGHQCKPAVRGGFVCPHKNYPLGGVKPGEDGIITCPMHGLRINADGVVLNAKGHPCANAPPPPRKPPEPEQFGLAF